MATLDTSPLRSTHRPDFPGTLNRRRLLQATAASGLLVAVGGPATRSALAAPARQDAPTQTLVAAFADGPNGTDIAFHAALRSIDIYRACALTPMTFNSVAVGDVFVPDFSTVVPYAAESWEVNPEWTSITINLRKGILSPFGNELTADDVLYSYQRIEATKGHNWPFMQNALNIKTIDNITKDDTYVYTIRSDAPNALLEIINAHGVFTILDSVEFKKHATDDDPWSVDWASSNIAGHGAWKLTEYTPGQSWTLERNENYFDPASLTGNVAKVVNRVVPESANRVALLQAGSVDMAMDLESAELESLQNAPGVRVDSLPGNHLQWLGFTFGSPDAPQLDDVNVRQAIGYALPFDELLARPYLNQAQQMKSTVAPSYAGYDVTSTVWNRARDVDKAKELLAGTEWASGFSLPLHYNLNAAGQEETAIIVKSALAEVGIEVNLVQVQSADYFNLAFGGAGFPGLFIYKDMAGTPDVNFGTHLWLKTGHCCAPGKYSNTDIDALYAEAQSSPDDFEKRVDLQRQIDDIALNQDPMGVPLQALGFHGSSRENVGGWWWQSLNELVWNKAWKK
ncbi:MAG: ABC transporter substrate-binding protein [Thermomicrobiales bacterium]